MDQFPEVYHNINRLKLSNKWKVRWKAIEFLKDQDENLQHNLIDSLRNKVLNTDLY